MSFKEIIRKNPLYSIFFAPWYQPLRRGWPKFLQQTETAFFNVCRTFLNQVPAPRRLKVFLFRALNVPAKASVRGQKFWIQVTSPTEWNRLQTYETKEPETLDWIDHFEKGEILFDLGANVGVYTLYAAARHGNDIEIRSFEPLSLNYAALNRNIHHNHFDKIVTAYCLAVSEKPEISTLHVPKFLPGGNRSQFGRALEGRDQMHREGIVGLPLDELCLHWGFPIPNHLKIDVDGIEIPILRGAAKTLANPAVKSVLIELGEPAEEAEAIRLLQEAGLEFELKADPRKGELNTIFRRKTPRLN